MKNEQQYPEWQKAIREAQAMRDEAQASLKESLAKKKREMVKNSEELGRILLQEYGIELVPNIVPEWRVENLVFSFFMYPDGSIKKLLKIAMDVPGAFGDFPFELFERGYRDDVEVEFTLANPTAPNLAVFADALDRLKERVRPQMIVNEAILEEIEAAQARDAQVIRIVGEELRFDDKSAITRATLMHLIDQMIKDRVERTVGA